MSFELSFFLPFAKRWLISMMIHSRLAEGQETAYEAWKIRLAPGCKPASVNIRFCGIHAFEWSHEGPNIVKTTSELYDQSELQKMHTEALRRHQAKQKGGVFLERFLNRGASNYEQDIDFRIRKYPDQVREEINQLLADRENASSNRFHNRAWKVVLAREQPRHRYSSAAVELGKKHRFGFAKKRQFAGGVEYLVVIKGEEGRPVEVKGGATSFKRFSNPWAHADATEEKLMLEKAREGEGNNSLSQEPGPGISQATQQDGHFTQRTDSGGDAVGLTESSQRFGVDTERELNSCSRVGMGMVPPPGDNIYSSSGKQASVRYSTASRLDLGYQPKEPSQ